MKEFKNYEISYWLSGQLSEEEAKAEEEKLRQLIEDFGFRIIERNFSGKRPLAYEIKHQSEGYFGYFQIEQTENSRLKDLKKELDLNKNILRYLTIVWEPLKKPMPKIAPIEERVAEVKEKKPVDLEELDKKLEEILKE